MTFASLPLPTDREIMLMLAGGGPYTPYSHGPYDPYDRGADAFSIPPALAQTILPMVLRTGRCFLPFEKDEMDKPALFWDAGDSWRFVLEVRGSEPEGWQLTGTFRRGTQRMNINEPLLVNTGGFLVTDERIATLLEDRTFTWIAALQQNRTIAVPGQERDEFLTALLSSPCLPALDLPEPLQYEEVMVSPRPCLRIARAKGRAASDRLRAELSFDYDGRTVLETTTASGIYEVSGRRFIRRDREREKAAAAQLRGIGMRFIAEGWYEEAGWDLAATKLPRLARILAESGWHVAAEGKVFRQPGQSSVSVSSGVDWFEPHGTVVYGEVTASLPQLLSAVKRGETMVTLDDGFYGLMPEEWLRRFGNVAALGEPEDERIRFRPSQAGLLDALLTTEPTAVCDAAFEHVRRELGQFQSIAPAEQPEGFCGHLRDYQREGLGWMHFLRQFHFGGCLADDMGVGKTAQVLALPGAPSVPAASH